MEERLNIENKKSLFQPETDQNSNCKNTITQPEETVNYLSPLEAALAYAKKGFKVFPVVKNDKNPACAKGYKDATDNSEIIKKWWGDNPHYNIGLPMALNGLVCIDIDNKPGKESGFVNLDNYIIAQDLPDLPITVEADTANNGRHKIYKISENIKPAGKLCSEVDIKYNGYLVVSPSKIDENRYEWLTEQGLLEMEPVELSEKWVEHLTKPVKVAKTLQNKPIEFERDEKGNYPPSSPEKMAERCNAVKNFIEHSPTLSEPGWNALLSLTVFCENGREYAHKWSENYNGYTPEETDRKIDEKLNFGKPMTCRGLQTTYGDEYCVNCEYSGKINTPVVLGREKVKSLLLPTILEKYVKNNEDFGEENIQTISSIDLKEIGYVKPKIHILKNNYYEVKLKKKNKEDESAQIFITRKSNFIIQIPREVIHYCLKFGYETEHQSEIITILEGRPTKKMVLTVNELYDFKNLSKILKVNGIHQYHLSELEYKNIIRKELAKKPIQLYSFENPGFNALKNIRIWLTENMCFDLNEKKTYLAGEEKVIKINNMEVCLKARKGFMTPEIAVLQEDENIEKLTEKYSYLQEVKSEYLPFINLILTTAQLVTLSLFHNVFCSYKGTIEPFLILGLAILSPFVSEIFEKLQGYPIGFAGGESQSGKSNLLISIAAIYGFNQNFLKSGNDTQRNTLHNMEYYSKIPILIQETGKHLRDKLEDWLIKPVYDRTGRGLMTSGEEQNVKAINATLIVASNNTIHRNLQTSSRLLFTDWKKENFSKDKAKLFNTVREELLSSILPDILSLDKDFILQKIEENAGVIEESKYEIDSRSINNIALAKTGLDILIKMAGFKTDAPFLKELDDKYTEFLKNYTESISLKDSLEMFLEVFEVLVREKKVTKNIDWKLAKQDSYLAIYLKSVYPIFVEKFKKVNESGTGIPTQTDIRNSAKNKGIETNYVVSFGSVSKKALFIPMDKHKHLLAILKDPPGEENTF